MEAGREGAGVLPIVAAVGLEGDGDEEAGVEDHKGREAPVRPTPLLLLPPHLLQPRLPPPRIHQYNPRLGWNNHQRPVDGGEYPCTR